MNYELQENFPDYLQTSEQKQLGLFLHLSQLAGLVIPFGGFIAPLVIWIKNRKDDPAIDAHGKMIFNWMISYLIYLTVFFVSLFYLMMSESRVFFWGIFVWVGFSFLNMIYPIIGGVKASQGELWNYPLAIKFLK